MKKNLLISFSGGRTSAFMCWWIWTHYKDVYNIVVVFANTGKEAEGTLKFVYEFGINFGIPIVWVEYRAGSEKGWKVNPKIVNYYTASRNGEPFEEMIAHVGIPSTGVPFCSTILKNRTIKAYLRLIKFKKYYTAIGIRSDEVDRVSEHYLRDKINYPLISSKHWEYIEMTKPEVIDWWTKMQDRYGLFNPRNTKLKPPFNFYRGNKSTHDIAAMSKLTDEQIKELTKNEKISECSESCEPFK